MLGVAPATLATPALTGTRLGLTPLETPASVSILSGDTIRERGDPNSRRCQDASGRRDHAGRPRQRRHTTDIPLYKVVDGGVRKRLTGRIAVDLHLYNLTNELYATDFYYNGFAPQWMLGTPRSAEASLTVGF